MPAESAAPGPDRAPHDRWTERAALAAVALALAPSWLLGHVPVRADATAYFWPLRARLDEALARGVLPLYDLAADGGTPLLLNPQTAALYPPSLLLALLPLSWGFAWLHAGHLLLLTAGVARLLRALGHRGAAVALGAVGVGLGGAALSLSAMQDKLFSLAWIPWAIAAALALTREGRPSLRRRAPALLAAVAALALSILAGGLDVVILGGIALVGLAAVDGGRSPCTARSLTRGALLGGACVVGGAALAAVQWLPFWSWLSTTDWEGGARAEALTRGLRAEHLLGLLSPNAGYQPSTDTLRLPWQAPGSPPVPFYLPGLYAGGAGLVLGLVGGAVGLRRAGAARVALVGIAACGVMALGGVLPPVGWAETHLPVLSMVRYPQKWVLPAVLLGAVLVAEGVRTLRAASAAPRPPDWVRAVALAPLVGSLALAIAAAVTPAAAGDAAGWRPLLSAAAAALATGGVVVLLLARSAGFAPPARAGFAVLAVAVAAVDLAAFDLRLAPVEDPQTAWATPPARALLGDDPDPPRVFPYATLALGRGPLCEPGTPLRTQMHEALIPGILAGHGLAEPYSWLAMHPAELHGSYLAMGAYRLRERAHRLWLAGSSHLLLDDGDEARTWQRVTHDDTDPYTLPAGARVVRVDGSPARGRCAVEVLAYAEPLPEVRWTPAAEPWAAGRGVEAGGRVEAPTARVTAERPGRLVWLRPWDPYWTATVDGAAVPTERVNGFQLSVPLPAGDHDVALRYRVPALSTGAGVSLGTAIALLAGAALARRRRPAG